MENSKEDTYVTPKPNGTQRFELTEVCLWNSASESRHSPQSNYEVGQLLLRGPIFRGNKLD